MVKDNLKIWSLIFFAWLLLLGVMVLDGHAQTLTLQTGFGASSNLGTKPGPIVEIRIESPWLYARGAFKFERKAYLNSGSIATGDLLARWTLHGVWAGAGVEVSRASTSEYRKTATRLLLGGGYGASGWNLGIFGFPPEYGTQNRSTGVRGELSLLPWKRERVGFIVTIRPFFMQYHNGPAWERVYSGGGVEGLVGMRWGK
jgi:hypothetical protein